MNNNYDKASPVAGDQTTDLEGLSKKNFSIIACIFIKLLNLFVVKHIFQAWSQLGLDRTKEFI